MTENDQKSKSDKSGISAFWAELKRRKVVRVAIVYVVVAWSLIEIADTVFPKFNIPTWGETFVILLLVIGFPIALIFAWAFQLTAEGIKAEAEIAPGQSVAPVKGNKLNYITLGLVVVVLTFLVVDRYLFDAPSLPREATPNAPGDLLLSKGVKRTKIHLEEGQHLALGGKIVAGEAYRSLALSPDGEHLCYVVNDGGIQQLYLRRLDAFEARPIEGTDGGYLPFFSPDGQWIGFLKQNQIMKVSIRGGRPQAIAEAGDVDAADWGPDDTILFVEEDRRLLSIVSADGGEKQTILDGFIDQPRFLPDGRGVLFTNRTTLSPSVELLLPETGEVIPLIKRGALPQYVSTGHILYTSDSGISAVPFDISTYTVKGPSVPVLNDVRREQFGYSHLTVSSDGLLAYVPGEDMSLSTPVWVDRNGKEESIPLLEPRRYRSFHLSPDDSKVAFLIDGLEQDVWIYDFKQAAGLKRATYGGLKTETIWSPDGNSILFGIRDPLGLESKIYRQGLDEGQPLPLISSEANARPTSWVKDDLLVYKLNKQALKEGDIWVARLDEAGVSEPFVNTDFNESGGRMSPDGRFIAYYSLESGTPQVFVKPYPLNESRWMISVDGGWHNVWSAKGDEIFYRNGLQIFSVSFQTEPEFTFEAPRLVVKGPYISVNDSSFDVTSDGQRFLMLKPIEQDPVSKIHVVTNWFEELERLVPSAQ